MRAPTRYADQSAMPPALLAFASGSGSRASGSPQLVFHTGRSRAVPGSDTPSVLSSYQGFVIQRCCGGSCISAQRQLQTGWARPWARPWALLWERTGLRPDVGRWEIRSIMRQVFRLVPPRSARVTSETTARAVCAACYSRSRKNGRVPRSFSHIPFLLFQESCGS